ncbi:MAG: hypothetical protein R2752_15870 [Vicinamibacterales bacterium]
MRAPRQRAEHPTRVGRVRRLAEHAAVDDDGGVGAEHDAPGVPRGRGVRLEPRDAHDVRLGRFVVEDGLVHVHGRHLEGDARRVEQFAAAGRGGGQMSMGQVYRSWRADDDHFVSRNRHRPPAEAAIQDLDPTRL